MDKQINGFTLIEMLFVVMILGVLIFIAVPIVIKSIERQEIKQFFAVLEADVFFIQNQALGTRQNYRIVFDEDYYIILGDKNGNDIKRHYPTHFTQDVKINNRVTFSTQGTIIDPIKLLFKHRDTKYKIVFPLGKGRYYVEEE